MMKNYFLIAWRNLLRNKAFSLVNISGLALGMACSLLIILWVQEERGVDNFHVNGSSLFQVYERRISGGKTDGTYQTQGPLAAELKRNYPEIKAAASLEINNRYTFEAGKQISRMDGTYAGADFFSMFSYPLLEGTAATALQAPGAVAVSRHMAEVFFGSAAAAIGKTIRFEDRENLQVTAVFENIPDNASRQFDFLRNWDDYTKANAWVSTWGSSNPDTYIQLAPGADAQKLEASIKNFIARYYTFPPGEQIELALQPYGERYLHGRFSDGNISGGRIEYVRLFSFLALFILVIACINFMNLATARSANRAKEVGVRKVLGAMRSSLAGQFAGEALLITCISAFIAIVIVLLLLPAFGNMTGRHIALPVTKPVFWYWFSGLLLFTGLLAGSYPALFLSSLLPVKVLKTNQVINKGAAAFRKGLVVFQFSVAVVLMIGMMAVYRQMDYIRNKHLGYEREHLLYIPAEGELLKNYELFRQEAEKIPGVTAISRMRQSPTVLDHHKGGISWTGKDPLQEASFADAAVDFDFVKTMKLQLKEGRDFSRAFATDSANFLINEMAAARMGYAHPLGQQMAWGDNRGEIIGVLKDFHFNSMHEAIEPLFIRLDNAPRWGTILVRTAAGKEREVLAALEKTTKALNPRFPFTYQFSDQEFTRLYRSEEVIGQLTAWFAFLAVFISCLGLFGLAAFTVEQRTKEIGIRKVLGASIGGIVVLLSGDFLKLVLLAVMIGAPVAWAGMQQWLSAYAYRTDLPWWLFISAGVLATGIAMMTVALHSIRAGMTDPVKTLKSA
ncbi:ABC transporter permease [Chitinophaga solisilvae]|uniref:ABC transporter permease n=1 Tax=Chitinophaga solisilvae TaxID=1233460 RepID=UPI0013709F3F|nr:ABC transporter permease [Chitinophaga solisilvae]